MICRYCNQSGKFKNTKGKKIHEKACERKLKENEKSTINIKTPPALKPTEKQGIWGIHTLKDLEQIFSAIYNEITKWRKNLFDIPSGSSGKRFIEESTRLVSE